MLTPVVFLHVYSFILLAPVNVCKFIAHKYKTTSLTMSKQAGKGSVDALYDQGVDQFAQSTAVQSPGGPVAKIAGSDLNRPALTNGESSDTGGNRTLKMRQPIGWKPLLPGTEETDQIQKLNEKAPPLKKGDTVDRDAKPPPSGSAGLLETSENLEKRQQYLIENFTPVKEGKPSRLTEKRQKPAPAANALTQGETNDVLGAAIANESSGFKSRKQRDVTQGRTGGELVPFSKGASANRLVGMSLHELREMFEKLDRKKEGFITHHEFIKGLRNNKEIGAKLGKSLLALIF